MKCQIMINVVKVIIKSKKSSKCIFEVKGQNDRLQTLAPNALC